MALLPSLILLVKNITFMTPAESSILPKALSKSSKNKNIDSQLKAFDLEQLKLLSQQYVLNKPIVKIPDKIESVKMYSRSPKEEDKDLYERAEARGRELVKALKVGAFLVAGGQGTRLGYDGPKGEYCVTPIKEKSLFQVFAEQLRAHSRQSSGLIPWYIMTSDVNDAVTKKFFEQNNYFGYNPQDVFFFKQGMMPAFSLEDGTLLMADKDNLALSPDGHGGSLRALYKSGALEDMRTRGVEHLSYFQVDNPLVHCIDYTFIGLHDLLKSEMSSKTIPKAHALEKVGNFVFADGKVQVIEYSDLPENLAKETNTDGTLCFNAGSIAIHALSVDFIERLNNEKTLILPWHRAEKKVAHINKQGELVKPETPNAVKLEQFIFDAIPFAKNSLVFETDRIEEFSPVKNAEGSDSPYTCREHQIRRASRWLIDAGIKVPMKDGKPDIVVEIDPLFASSRRQLKARNLKMTELKPGSALYFGEHGVEDYQGKSLEPTHELLKKMRAKIIKLVNGESSSAASA